MSTKPISQKEARRLKARVRQLEIILEEQRHRWGQHWPGGKNIATSVTPDTRLVASIETARLLGHAVVVTVMDGRIYFYALPHPQVPA